jgi:hypothetical protein
MSSPPVNIPHKEDSRSRRSALTSAFEELAVFADQKTDEVRVRAREPVGDGIPAASLHPRDAAPPTRNRPRTNPTHAEIPARTTKDDGKNF